jgi:hypothetical protein
MLPQQNGDLLFPPASKSWGYCNFTQFSNLLHMCIPLVSLQLNKDIFHHFKAFRIGSSLGEE